MIGSSDASPGAIVWWEKRRLLFNAVLLVTGTITVCVLALVGAHVLPPGEDAIEPIALLFGIVAYGIAANFCYSLGWITEILWSGGDYTRTSVFRPKIFRLGLLFSVVLTLLPAVIIPAVWALVMPVSACDLAKNVDEVQFLRAPPGLIAEFTRSYSPFALPGERFDATDIVRYGVSRRLIWVRHSGTRWIIAFEQGGRGYNVQVLAYDVSADGRSVQLVDRVTAFPDTACGISNRLLGAEA